MGLQLVSPADGQRELKRLIRQSVKDFKLECGVLPENSGIDGIEGRAIVIPIIAVQKVDDLLEAETFTHWRSMGTPGNIHLFLTVRTNERERLFHFDAQKKEHIAWLTVFCNTSLRGPLGMDGEKYGLRDGHIGLISSKNPGLVVHIPPTETSTVGAVIIAMRLMSAVAPMVGKHGGH